MSVDYTCFLELARDSLDKNGELWTRNSISRSYYGMYHSALRMTNNHTPSHTVEGDRLPGGSHMRFYTACCSGEAAVPKGLDVEKVKKIGIQLKMLHSKRVDADYRLDRKVNRITAISALKDAEDVDILISQMLNPDSESLTA